MDKVIEWFSNLPKFVKIFLAVVVFFLLFYAVVVFAFGDKFGSKSAAEERPQVLLDVQGATTKEENLSKIDTYKRQTNSNVSSAEDAWNSLGGDDDGGLNPDGGSNEGGLNPRNDKYEGEYLDPAEYSEIERYYIQSGTVSKAEIDARHKRQKAEDDSFAAEKAKHERVNSQEYQDSLYLARMEKAYVMAQKYAQPPQNHVEQKPVEKEEVTEKEEPRHIDIPQEETCLPAESFRGNDIISSLGSEQQAMTYSDGKVTIQPAKATFLKTERIIAGQRVVMRLMQDLKLSDGTVIPSNTHITGICSVGKRLDIKISTIQYGGRMFHSDLSVYDNDGTEGIYCPVIEKRQTEKSSKNIAKTIGSGVASTAAGLFTGNAYGARVAQQSIYELSKVALDDGSVAINVVSGYEFYLFENVKKKKRESLK